MKAVYMLACGVVWRKTADPEAGWDLVDGLNSADAEVRLLAQTFLVDSGESSMGLLESALALGIVDPDVAGPCMAEIFRNRHAKTVSRERFPEHCADVSLRGEVTHSN